jgi:HD-GYP domain-containing protein (c-di-GMP phosphodiesterase class II)
MELGRTIYGPNGRVLLRKGLVLREALISTLKKQNYPGVYVDDEISKDIEVEDVIDDELRNDTTQKLKNLFVTLQDGTPSLNVLEESVADLNEMINNLVDQVFNNKHMVYNLVDLKNHDDYTFRHSVNVSALSTVLGVALHFSRQALVYLARGALFHDIGKMFLDKDILNKKGELTPEEYEHVKEHSQRGFEYVKTKLNFSAQESIAILQHHEKVDGTGYPHGRVGRDIHLNAQVVSIADVFDAMTSYRVYHDARLPSEAMEYIMGNVGQRFDAGVVDAFLKKVAAYPTGITVQLSNGLKGIVCENFEGMTMRPRIKLFTDNPAEPVYIDLREPEHMAVTIMGVLH